MDHQSSHDANSLGENLPAEFDYDSIFAQVQEKVMINIRNQREESQHQQQTISRVNLTDPQEKPKVGT